MSKTNKKYKVFRYTLGDRLMHWSVAIGFILLAITGFMIFFQGSAFLLTSGLGKGIRILHRVGAVLFVAAPLIYLLFSNKRWSWLEVFQWDQSDLGWLKAAPKHYFIGGDSMPPQKKYNTGQKLYYLFVVIFGPILALSGFALWFDWFKENRFIMLLIHDIAALILVAFFFVHVYLSAIHPRERISLEAMTTGYMDQEYAEHHHKLWYDEVK
ncbi:formate dehydrogenase subunit gamma [Tepidibacillus fermentans]|uniref:Formate dehydrogenase subunit gamma n=1 Tax=Tepidibacillus fermentans TaxID=1281767 RepID=A0A4R3KDV1_9BACI|nr:cytochrome b/b6 domain-containing protein [Tepidibacillus fermentans]TCS81275.1 formate dehydrogenase subunit gamma [Tepidibacillus fermentans]